MKKEKKDFLFPLHPIRLDGRKRRLNNVKNPFREAGITVY